MGYNTAYFDRWTSIFQKDVSNCIPNYMESPPRRISPLSYWGAHLNFSTQFMKNVLFEQKKIT